MVTAITKNGRTVSLLACGCLKAVAVNRAKHPADSVIYLHTYLLTSLGYCHLYCSHVYLLDLVRTSRGPSTVTLIALR